MAATVAQFPFSRIVRSIIPYPSRRTQIYTHTYITRELHTRVFLTHPGKRRNETTDSVGAGEKGKIKRNETTGIKRS